MPDELSVLMGILERSGLAYALTGSLASTAWGRPRATYDADVVIDLKLADVLVWPPRFRSRIGILIAR